MHKTKAKGEEAIAIIRFLDAQRHKLKGEDKREVAVITPYGAQKRTIRAMMAKVCDHESHDERNLFAEIIARTPKQSILPPSLSRLRPVSPPEAQHNGPR
ncbi:hypothetical protein SAMN04488540_105190 [Ferrimonas sediminum]|uniref:Uncharacterized protein n=1 Tax=Ferrimonas sediminum TaxID=718193 RepID=A0A1G8RIX9_9GAMM|nr:hypothetical protein [Ferrimonas sediminum]SDJ16901.1 hypothetical protein SAMN04488540_105190 [Ferrimonas sediminum]